MNNLAKILEKIELAGQAQIEAIQQEYDKRLAKVDAETAEAIAAWEDAHNAEVAKDSAAILAREKASAAMQCREIVMREKASLIEEVYHRAEKVILALPEDEYAAFLTGFAASAITERVETVRFLQTEYKDEAFCDTVEVYTLHFSPCDKEKYGERVLGEVKAQVAAVLTEVPVIQLGAEPVHISGGVVVRYGDTETSCALSVLLGGLRDRLDPVVNQVLFAQG